jgi:hypothetical protein
MILLVKTDISGDVPFPEISAGGFLLPRGVTAFGGPPVAARLPKPFMLYAYDGGDSLPGLVDYMHGIGYLVVSDKLRKVWEQFTSDVEYVPIDILYNEDLVENYYVANPTQRIAGVDLSASTIELDDLGIALSVERLVIDEARFEGVPIAVLSETVDLVVHEEVAIATQNAMCTGCVFLSPEEARF